MTKLVAFHSSMGLVLGELVEENLDGDITVKNPVNVVPTATNVTFVPLLPIVKETEMTFKQKDRIGNLLTPLQSIESEYIKMFSSLTLPANV
nr:MAG TPA: hypothetical protein [Caudoviricetes sp.]